MANKKSKVKSYARRTKSGVSRVTGHNRDNNRNRNIVIGVGIGTSVLALGLGAKHLAKKKGLKGNTPPTQGVSFTPNKPNNPTPKPKVETPSATVAELRQTTKDVVDKAKEKLIPQEGGAAKGLDITMYPDSSPLPKPKTKAKKGKRISVSDTKHVSLQLKKPLEIQRQLKQDAPFVPTIPLTPKKPNIRQIKGRVRLKTKNKRRVHTLKDTGTYAEVLETKKLLPVGTKVEFYDADGVGGHIPKKYNYKAPTRDSDELVHATDRFGFRDIARDKSIRPSVHSKGGRAKYGDGVYLSLGDADSTMYGSHSFVFPRDKLQDRLLRANTRWDVNQSTSKRIYWDKPRYADIERYVGRSLPTSKASKVVVTAIENPKKPKNVKIRYKKRLSKLISFIKKAAN